MSIPSASTDNRAKKERRGRQMLRPYISSSLVPFAPFSSLPCRIGLPSGAPNRPKQSVSQPPDPSIPTRLSIPPFCLHVRLSRGRRAHLGAVVLFCPRIPSFPLYPRFLPSLFALMFFAAFPHLLGNSPLPTLLLAASLSRSPAHFGFIGIPSSIINFFCIQSNNALRTFLRQKWLQMMLRANYCASVFSTNLEWERCRIFPPSLFSLWQSIPLFSLQKNSFCFSSSIFPF